MIENIGHAIGAGAEARGEAKAQVVMKRASGAGGWPYLLKFYGLIGFLGGCALLIHQFHLFS